MTVQEQAPTSSFDAIKWILAVVALAGAVYANHYLVDGSVLIRVGVIIALVAIGLGIGFSTTKGKTGLAFAKESRIEARKVVWPSRNETVQTTLIIIVAVTIVSLLLWGIDALIVQLINFLTVRG
ncbi:preprotein translocase subunit SecE [Aliikangiella coralliicola]|uniref:Protein translocase subunit SecE n=1 Tax=Aliikangiella coralliicola TaxID=2592383 RepID=A0A545U7T0_9GAMM|nr:preprotein translocase subunit SecE [Aliikangiella coralliicola]TQV85524.1 preprotein translocase subunit SecE [Aliikangiella coralliicola]